jgi:hypothetical protein
MIIHCETCKADLLETESDRRALDLKDTHEFEHEFEHPDHPVNIYIEHKGRRIRLVSLIGAISVNI